MTVGSLSNSTVFNILAKVQAIEYPEKTVRIDFKKKSLQPKKGIHWHEEEVYCACTVEGNV